MRNFSYCDKSLVMSFVVDCMGVKWDLFCRMQLDNCFYMVRCVNMKLRKDEWKCIREYFFNSYFICCDLICFMK